MGATRLRDDESKFITQTRESKEIRDILKGDRGAQAKAATRIEELYRAEFSHALGGETDAEYAERKKSDPKAKRLTAESEEERQRRLDRIHGVRAMSVYPCIVYHSVFPVSSSSAFSNARVTSFAAIARRRNSRPPYTQRAKMTCHASSCRPRMHTASFSKVSIPQSRRCPPATRHHAPRRCVTITVA